MEYTNSQMRRLIDEHIHSERDRRIAARRFLDGITVERLSEEFFLSPRQTRDILRKCKDTISRHLPG